MKSILFFLAALFASSLLASDGQEVVINEQSLWQRVLDNPPSVQMYEASHFSNKYQLSRFQEKFDSTVDARASYSKSDEKQLSQFMPVTSPVYQFSLGVNKNTMMGMQLGASIYAQQTTNSFLTKATTAGVRANFAFDLYKNIGGKLSKAQREGLKLGSEYSVLDKKSKIRGFFINVRRVYWSLVANNEAINLTNRLIYHSKSQVDEALKRLASRVADEAEVAQYRSQLSARKAQLYSLKYQREVLWRQLKELLPELADKKVVLDHYDLEKDVGKVLACTVLIKSHKESPLDFTYYDEMVEVLKKQQAQTKIVNEGYDQIDLKLLGQADYIGKDFSFGDSFTDLTDNGKPALSLGLQLSIPLGEKIKNSADFKKTLDRKRFTSQIESKVGKVEAFHYQLVRSIELLKEVVKNQQLNSIELEKSLKISKKKYNQARINVQQLLQQQDMYLQSSLQVIEVKTQTVNTLLDYFSVFTETPCQFNEFKL